MGIFVRFCGYGQAVLELKRILKVVLGMDGQHAVDCPHRKVNEPHFGRLQGFAFNGVVQNISEQRENVHRFHKGHAAAIGNAGELYIVGMRSADAYRSEQCPAFRCLCARRCCRWTPSVPDRPSMPDRPGPLCAGCGSGALSHGI